MAELADGIPIPLSRLDAAVAGMSGRYSPAMQAAIERWQMDAGALRFHLGLAANAPVVTVVLGGTGTGKSTLVNRIVGAAVTAASFQRTFTAGPVAVVRNQADLPQQWLGIEHTHEDQLPARGEVGRMVIVQLAGDGEIAPLVDTPDLDGDQPAHHLQADRAFRWAGRVLFVVTPEKYQMTELLPYYRLARRYAVPALFVMNKVEEPGVLDDFARQLAEREWADAMVFAVPRDDAAYEAIAEKNLPALRAALVQAVAVDTARKRSGLVNRVDDLVARLVDQIIAPLRQARLEADRLIASVRAMEAPAAGVDVNPITLQLQRRLQQRSVLYLIGPQRMLDRVRQVPTLLARLPRATWDWVMRGHAPADLLNPKSDQQAGEPPDFRAILMDQFTVVRSRIDDAVQANALGQQWAKEDADGFRAAMIEPSKAGDIADDEIGRLKQWLETRWNATPRDTRMLQALLKHLPGGKQLTRWSEAAPYLLTIALITHHALFGHIDLMVLGGYSLATWLTERLSNEVSSHTRSANRRIGERFEKLAHEQIGRVCQWLQRRTASEADLVLLERLAGDLAEAAK